MKPFQITYLVIVLLLTSCFNSNVLTYKNRTHYLEQSSISSDTTFQLTQSICYNEPQVIDEEYCYTLKLTFLDTFTAKTKRILDLETDTTIVKAEYGKFSVWNWSSENNHVKGTIEITFWDSNKVTLMENLVATDFRRKEKIKFKGTRSFTRNKEKKHYEN